MQKMLCARVCVIVPTTLKNDSLFHLYSILKKTNRIYIIRECKLIKAFFQVVLRIKWSSININIPFNKTYPSIYCSIHHSYPHCPRPVFFYRTPPLCVCARMRISYIPHGSGCGCTP